MQLILVSFFKHDLIHVHSLPKMQLPVDDLELEQYTTEPTSVGGAADPMAIDVSGHVQVVEYFVRSVQGKTAPFVDRQKGKKAVDFVCAIYDAIRTGLPVRLA